VGGSQKTTFEPPSVPISPDRIETCRKSAAKWEAKLGAVASDAHSKATWWAWIGVGCGTVVGLGVWPTIAASHAW